MKATGIVRRVDDLGRIVIPKEIRRTLRIRKRIASGSCTMPGSAGSLPPESFLLPVR